MILAIDVWNIESGVALIREKNFKMVYAKKWTIKNWWNEFTIYH